MYFLQWLWARFKRKVLGAQWRWVEDYRRTIIRAKSLAILMTVGLGLIWFLAVMLGIVLFSDTPRASVDLYWVPTISAPAVFFIYNWLMALYEIFETERMATWETLKE